MQSRTTVKGFTLTEMVVTMAVSAIMLTTLGRSTMMLMQSNIGMAYKSEMNMQSDRAMEKLTNDLREAVDVLSPLSLNSFTIVVPVMGNAEVEYEAIKYLFNRHVGTVVRIKVTDPIDAQLYQENTSTTSSGANAVDAEELLLIEGADYCNFTYYNGQGEATDTALDVKKIKMNVTIARGTDINTKVYLDVSNSTFLRNRITSN